MQHNSLSVAHLAGIIGVLLVALFSVSVLSAWTAPTQTAPAGNTVPPINIGSSDQVKDGGLSLNALAVFGNALVAGSGGTSYVNFGSSAGSSGYGFRNNNGTMQFKNQSGEWIDICDCATPPAPATEEWVAYGTKTGGYSYGTNNIVLFSKLSTDVQGPYTHGGNTFYVWNPVRKYAGTWDSFVANPQAAFDQSVVVPVGYTPMANRYMFNLARFGSYSEADKAVVAANAITASDVNATQCHSNNHRVINFATSRSLSGTLYHSYGDSNSQFSMGPLSERMNFQVE